MKECYVLPKPSGHRRCPPGSAPCCWHLPQGHGAAWCIINQISQYHCQPQYQQLSSGSNGLFPFSLSNLHLIRADEGHLPRSDVVWREGAFFGWFMPFFVCS